MSAKRKTDPKHKASFSYGVQCRCSCGWQTGFWLGKGAKGNAAGEWHIHREQCEKARAMEAANVSET